MKRNHKVKREALRRANGCCEKCYYAAEFWIHEYMREDGLTRAKAIAAICEVKGWGNKRALLEVDHRVPLALGGRDEVSNTITLCVACHQAKRDQTKIAKCRRVSKRQADFEARMREKAGR